MPHSFTSMQIDYFSRKKSMPIQTVMMNSNYNGDKNNYSNKAIKYLLLKVIF